MQFSKRNKQTPLLPLPEINSIYHAKSAGSRDQPRPGSFLQKREEPRSEVVIWCDGMMWHGVMCFRIVRSGMIWYSRCGTDWYGMVFSGILCGYYWCELVWFGMIWCCLERCPMFWCGLVWCGVVQDNAELWALLYFGSLGH